MNINFAEAHLLCNLLEDGVSPHALRGLPHYKQLNFGGGSDWLGATAAALMGTTHAGDKNNVL